MYLSNKPISFIGTGAITSVGMSAVTTAAAVRAGISGFQEHSYMVNKEGDPYILGMVPSINPDIIGVKRYIELVTPSILEALVPLQQLAQEQRKINVLLGLPEKRPGLPIDLAERLSYSIRSIDTERYQIKEVSTTYKGHTSGLMALAAAENFLSEEQCEFCLVGGVDSYFDPVTLDWIENNEQLHTPLNAWGFIPGEAAAFCLLCSTETANQYQFPIKAQLLAAATVQEKNCIKTETVCIGEGLTAAVRETMQALPEGMKIDQTYCDQNGEAYRADEFGFMLARLAENFVDPSEYIAPADCWGDVGAASGPLFINLHCAASEKAYNKGSISLLWASSEAGDRSAVILTSIAEQEGEF
jgi:3-oxoacyl-[acyl-carrier-protein] synthase I